MEKKEIVDKIKSLAYENVNKKIEEEKKKTENKLNEEIDQVEKILKYINNKLLFKEIGERWNCNYKLVTEEIFFEDFNKEPEYDWKKGIKINFERKNKWDCFIEVNGERYYDIRYIIRNYEETFEFYNSGLELLRKSFNEIRDKAEELKMKEKAIKRLIQEYENIKIDE
jgi:hypothetical protein